jgi:hypothetical protein
MEALKSEIKGKNDGEVVLKQAIADLKVQARTGGPPPSPKKDKAGLKKFLTRRFNRPGGSSTTTNGTIMPASTPQTKPIDPPCDKSFVSFETHDMPSTIHPPSMMHRSDNCSVISEVSFEPSEARSSVLSHKSEAVASVQTSKDSSSGAAAKSASEKRRGKAMPPVAPKICEETMATPKAGNTFTRAFGRSPSPSKTVKMANTTVPTAATAPATTAAQAKSEPYSMTRTASKAHVKENGEVELEVTNDATDNTTGGVDTTTPKATEPYSMTRTRSKALIADNGEVELEVVGSPKAVDVK